MAVTIVCIHNCFDPMRSRQIVRREARTVGECVSSFRKGKGYDYSVSINGHVMPDNCGEFPVHPGDSVVFCAVPGRGGGGGGKNPLAIVAMIAVMVVAIATVNPALMGVAGDIGLTGAWATAFAAVGTSAFVAVGGMVVNAVFPTPIPDYGPMGGGAGGMSESSPTYGWEVAANPMYEGGVLPEVFGVHRVTPPLIGKFIETQNDLQYLNLLYALCGHEIDYISNVRINENYATGYDGTVIEWRLGEVNQAPLPMFLDIRSDVAVGTELDAISYVTKTTTGDSVTSLFVTLSLPEGLWYFNDQGGLDPQTVNVYVEFRISGGGAWTRVISTNTAPLVITTGRWYSGFWFTHYTNEWVTEWFTVSTGSDVPGDHVEGSDAGYVEGFFITYMDESLGTTSTWWSGNTIWRWIAGETVVQPGTTTLDYVQITGSTREPLKRTIWLFSGATPGTYEMRCKLVTAPPTDPVGRYGNKVVWESFQEQIVGDSFSYPGTALLAVRALATNRLSGQMPRVDVIVARTTVPVWTGAAYEDKAATNPAWACYHLLHRAGDGVDKDRIVYDVFHTWADWCDTNGYTVNVYVDTAMSMRRALDMISLNGRAMVVQMGSTFTAIVDKQEDVPVQRFLFTAANIEKDSFREEWLPMDQRANAIEVTYYDVNEDYTRQVVEILSTDFDTMDREENKTSVTLYGCTSRTQAIRHGKFLLNCNRYLTQTVSFAADVDALACMVGDVIDVAHEVPQWGYSGRAVSSTNNTITVDRTLTIEAGHAYTIKVRHLADDTVEEKTVITGPGDTDTLEISGTWTLNPSLHDVYAFGQTDIETKPFRVTNISRESDLRRKVTAVEYVAEVYDDAADIPDPVVFSDLPGVARLTATEVWKGGAETFVQLTWSGVAIAWGVWYRQPTGAWVKAGTATSPSFRVGGLDYGIKYTFGVTDTEKIEDGETVSITLVGKTLPPSDVTTFTATPELFGTILAWSRVTDFDADQYEIRSGASWDLGAVIYRGKELTYTWPVVTAGSYTLWIKAIDGFGNYSVNATEESFAIIGPVITPPSLTYVGPDVVIEWSTGTSQFTIDHYELRYGTTWAGATVIGNQKGTVYRTRVTWSGTRRFWVAAVDAAGNYSAESSVDSSIVNPGAVVSYSAMVIDNNVLLKWSAPATGTMPVEYYEVRRGATWAGGTVVGRISGTFTVLFESVAGNYTYWVAAYDTAGNEGTTSNVPTSVSQPPDYSLLVNWQSAFDDTLSNALLENGKVILPVNTTETFAEHFTTPEPDWATPQAQVDAGYEIFIEPSQSTGHYEETFDYGVVIDVPTKITVAYTLTTVDGAPTSVNSLKVSEDNVNWTDHGDVTQAVDVDFRYVKFRLTVNSVGGDDLALIESLEARLDLKTKTDSGRVEVTANPTQVDFNTILDFIDVQSITVTPEGTTPLYAVYDFTDIPNPTHFHVYVFDSAGDDASGAGVYCSWIARGV